MSPPSLSGDAFWLHPGSAIVDMALQNGQVHRNMRPVTDIIGPTRSSATATATAPFLLQRRAGFVVRVLILVQKRS